MTLLIFIFPFLWKSGFVSSARSLEFCLVNLARVGCFKGKAIKLDFVGQSAKYFDRSK